MRVITETQIAGDVGEAPIGVLHQPTGLVKADFVAKLGECDPGITETALQRPAAQSQPRRCLLDRQRGELLGTELGEEKLAQYRYQALRSTGTVRRGCSPNAALLLEARIRLQGQRGGRLTELGHGWVADP
ncbi:MAG: hypothetical protein PVG82_01455 [Chromatiales bacterium]|jgi:hypothetical protein